MTTGKTFKNVIAGMALVAACACAASVDVVVTNSYELTLGTGRTVSPATSWAATDVRLHADERLGLQGRHA